MPKGCIYTFYGRTFCREKLLIEINALNSLVFRYVFFLLIRNIHYRTGVFVTLESSKFLLQSIVALLLKTLCAIIVSHNSKALPAHKQSSGKKIIADITVLDIRYTLVYTELRRNLVVHSSRIYSSALHAHPQYLPSVALYAAVGLYLSHNDRLYRVKRINLAYSLLIDGYCFAPACLVALPVRMNRDKRYITIIVFLVKPTSLERYILQL